MGHRKRVSQTANLAISAFLNSTLRFLRYKINIVLIFLSCFVIEKTKALTLITKTLNQFDQRGRNAFSSSTGQKALPKNVWLDYLAVALPAHLPYEGQPSSGFETLKSLSETLR